LTKRIVVTGATGLLGGYIVTELRRRLHFDVTAFGGPSRDDNGFDLANENSVRSAIEKVEPHAVIHSAALSAMADCARDPERAKRINVDGTRHVALACRSAGARLVHVSTDLVFDGEAAPYRETDAASPISVYGRTKLEAESAALKTNDDSTTGVSTTVAPAAPTAAAPAAPAAPTAAGPAAPTPTAPAASSAAAPAASVSGGRATVVVRVSLLFGPTLTARRGFFDSQIDAFRSSGAPNLTLFEDEWRTPLSLRAAAEGLVAIAAAESPLKEPILHLGGPERLSRLEMGLLLRDLVAPGVAIQKGSRLTLGGEPRPRDVSLDSTLFRGAFPEIAKKTFREEALEMTAVNTKRESV
jgi:dTDP-4-dehydrorhamnose reductase